MFIWRGWGALVIGIVFLRSLVGNLFANLLGGATYWDSHGWPLACALIVAGGIIWLVDARLAKRPERVLLDETTGERVVLRRSNDFFFIRMRWWGVICACLAILILATRWSPGSP